MKVKFLFLIFFFFVSDFFVFFLGGRGAGGVQLRLYPRRADLPLYTRFVFFPITNYPDEETWSLASREFTGV